MTKEFFDISVSKDVERKSRTDLLHSFRGHPSSLDEPKLIWISETEFV